MYMMSNVQALWLFCICVNNKMTHRWPKDVFGMDHRLVTLSHLSPNQRRQPAYYCVHDMAQTISCFLSQKQLFEEGNKLIQIVS